MGADKANILIIDDDEDIKLMLTSLLTQNGYATDTAQSGAEAIEKLSKRRFNLALIDIVLPDIRGTQLLPQMKEIAPRIRKIIITGHASLDNAIEALNAGADAYVKKPFDPQQLLKIIDEKLHEQWEEQRALNLLYEALKVLEPEHVVRTGSIAKPSDEV
jgi:DNA-binding NtrC family response regulator